MGHASLSNSSIQGKLCPVVICPGFGNDKIDYEKPFGQSQDVCLKSVLLERGFDVHIVPIKRAEWLKIALGIFDFPNFYVGRVKPTGLGYGWYLKRLKETVDLAYEKSGGRKVLLIGHSAGGWLSRAAMGDGSWSSTELEEIDNKEQRLRTSDRIRCLVTLGAPHRPPKDESLCITRGALKYTDMNYPGSFLREEGISYVSIGSAAIRGVQTENHTKDEGYIEFHNQNGNAEKTAYIIYEAVSGNGNSVGDGVIPLHYSMLEGAKQIQLDSVFHSFHESTSINPTKRWYGSEEIIDEWLPIVLEEAGLCPNVFENPEIKMKVEISKEINEGANNIVKLCRRVQNWALRDEDTPLFI